MGNGELMSGQTSYGFLGFRRIFGIAETAFAFLDDLGVSIFLK